ncbi:uncharacterized protein LOC116304654, partial [Actinia tenebrosa]|uniref:Uncharacterized protein LOC116304654 n=1 Tax=Actinia tenebrosa TaxID=6105 RepID=A0A6P8ITE3_ACTTE
MVHYCCVFNCYNSSNDTTLSFHGFPKDKSLQKKWTSRIKRDPSKDFRITPSTKVCSSHFLDTDYKFLDSKSRRLKEEACPSIFSWSKTESNERPLSVRREQLQRKREMLKDEETESASEGEGFYDMASESTANRGNQTDLDIPCSHQLSIKMLKTRCPTSKKGERFFSHHTGFKNYMQFKEFLEFVVPGLKRENIVYWGTDQARNNRIDTSALFKSIQETKH